MPLIFFNLSPCVWENNGLLNKNYWDDLDTIDQCHSKGNRSQFCLYLGYPWTNLNIILNTMLASRPETKKNVIADLENMGQGHHLHKSL